ncbi:MAG: carboxypeptidase-like regulatory domain-containing protein [Thermoplasmata archaeon]|nr:carboxypeptidase-like regulatory domain-containing protein [Thermoplasmata archaeon]
MGPPVISVRCPACGGPVTVLPSPSPPTQWFPCPHCHAPVPVVLPRDPPPLYSWEVIPGLYPYLPTPRVPRWRASRAAAGALVSVAIIAAVLAGTLGYYAVAATVPASFSVSGTITLQPSGGSNPYAAIGALVVATDEAGHNYSTSSGIDGAFVLNHLPTGGIAVNVSFPGFAPETVDIFLSSVYSAGSSELDVTLVAGNVSNGTLGSVTPFVNLETFVAAIGGGVVLLGLVAAIAGAAAILTLRSDRPALGVVGGGAGLFAPLALVFLDLGDPFPILLVASALVAAIGGFALGIRAIEMGMIDAAPD